MLKFVREKFLDIVIITLIYATLVHYDCWVRHSLIPIYEVLSGYCHVHPLVVVHAPASCGRGLEGDGRTILQLTRRRR